MIPVSFFSIPQLLLILLPFLTLALSVGLLLHALWWKYASTAPVFWTRTTIALTLLALAGDLWGLFLWHKIHEIEKKIELQTYYQEARRRFVLPRDYQYGELLVPKGSIVSRYDPFDNGEPQIPLSLRGLRSVRFAHAVQVGGVWATALDASPMRLELARDQSISPVFHFDPAVNPGYGAWVADPGRAALHCQKGQIARFHVPLIDYDIQEEFGKPEPDGPDARFKPSQWGVLECDNAGDAIGAFAPYPSEDRPAGAQTQVWSLTEPLAKN